MKITQNWKEHIKNWQASGKSCMAYCKEHGLSYSSFRYNLKKSTKPDKVTQKEYPFEDFGFLEQEEKRSIEDEMKSLFIIKLNQNGEVECKVNLRFQFMLWNFE